MKVRSEGGTVVLAAFVVTGAGTTTLGLFLNLNSIAPGAGLSV